jgi:hypothetical protein
MFQIKIVEKITTYILHLVTFFSENSSVYEIMWKSTLEPESPQMTVWRMHIACCIHKATNSRSEYVTPAAFPMQQWLHKRTPMLLYMYNVCLVSVRIMQEQIL